MVFVGFYKDPGHIFQDLNRDFGTILQDLNRILMVYHLGSWIDFVGS